MAKKSRQQPLRGTTKAKSDLADAYKVNTTRNIPVEDLDEKEAKAQTEAPKEQKKSKDKKEPKIKFDEAPSTEDTPQNADDDIATLKGQLIRKAAELENFRKRTLKEKQELLEYGNRNVFLRLIDISDDFEKAFEVGEKSTTDSQMLEGFRMIYSNMKKIFEDFGVKEIAVKPKEKFNVEYHEAIMAMESELPEGTIMHIAQKGYVYGEKVLRYAKVVTAKGADE